MKQCRLYRTVLPSHVLDAKIKSSAVGHCIDLGGAETPIFLVRLTPMFGIPVTVIMLSSCQVPKSKLVDN